MNLALVDRPRFAAFQNYHPKKELSEYMWWISATFAGRTEEGPGLIQGQVCSWLAGEIFAAMDRPFASPSLCYLLVSVMT